MMESTLVPYLNFNGNAAEAMKFYHSILGGELKLQTFGEANMSKAPGERDMIVHAELKSGAVLFMASDTQPSRMTRFGDNIHMSLMGGDHERLTEIFSKLSEGGSVEMPLAKQFWGDTFGMLTDKYGVHWMVNIAAKP